MLRLRSYTGRTRILSFEMALSQSPSFPVPLDKGNEDSGDEIDNHLERGSKMREITSQRV